MSAADRYAAYRAGAGAPKTGSSAPTLPLIARQLQPIFNDLYYRLEKAEERDILVLTKLDAILAALEALIGDETPPEVGRPDPDPDGQRKDVGRDG